MVRLIIMTDFTESYGFNILRGIIGYAGRNWFVHKMPPAFKQRYGFDAVLKWAKDWKADAIVGRFDIEDPVEKFRENGILAIAQDYKQRFTRIPNITGGYHETGAMAAEYFLAKGFKHFAFFGHQGVVWSEERFAGYKTRLIAKGVSPDNIFEYSDDRYANDLAVNDSDVFSNWLTSLPKPAAVFCCDDNEASNLIDICNWQGIKIPEEVAVLGVDNSDIAAEICNPALSSITLDTTKAAYEVAAKIDRAVNGDGYWNNENILVKPLNIASRLSTDSFSTDNEVIVKVLKYISQNYMYRISVSDLVELVPVSRRVLEMLFRQETGQSMLQYINKFRMSRFAHLLINSNEPINNLSSMVGFDDPSNIARVFRRTFGLTPREYRKQKGKG